MILDCGHEENQGSPTTVNGKTVQGWTFVLRDNKKICHACDNDKGKRRGCFASA